MKTRNSKKRLFMTMLATPVIALSALALHSTNASLSTREDVTLTQSQDGGVSANVGFILFTTDRDNPSTLGMCPTCEEIYVMSPDGFEQKRLTDNDANDSAAVWSLEAKRIAFQTNRNGYTQIFLMRKNGTEQHLLADLGVNELGVQLGAQFPSWSPTGEQLCFSSQLRPREIFIIDADGGRLTNLTNNPGDDLRCDWSPLGNKIAFGSTRDDGEEIYVMNTDGSDPVRLTFASGADANPDWSPNGERIAFESNRDGNPEIYVMNADGTQPVRLTFFAGQDTKPSWSPKGDKIAFHRRILGHLEVFTMNPDGTDVLQITFTVSPGFSGFPSWAKGKLGPLLPEVVASTLPR